MIHALTFAFISVVLQITIGIAVLGLEIRLLVPYLSASEEEDGSLRHSIRKKV